MELKSNNSDDDQLYVGSSNRTFMELKYKRKIERYGLFLVLIVPLWN